MEPYLISKGLVLVIAICAAPLAAYAQAASPSTSLLRWERDDIAVFNDRFLNVDHAYTATTKKLAEIRLSTLQRATSATSPIKFAVELCRIAALADNGHTECLSTPLAGEICHEYAVLDGGASTGCTLHSPDFRVPDFNRVAIYFYPFGQTFYVVETRTVDADLLGARVLAVDGRSIESIHATLRTFSGGTAAFRDLQASSVLSSPEELNAVGIAERSDSVTYRFLTPVGKTMERTFRVEPAAPNNTEWRWIPSPEHAPWAFQDEQQPFRWRDAPEIDAVVIQLRQNVDADKEKIADFLESAEAARERLHRRNVVLDMRFNGGGNFLLTRQFMLNWPSRVRSPGRFFVLTARKTFSAAIASIAYLKQAGGNRVVFVGEAPGDRLMFFSDGRPIQLPHSSLFFSPSIARQDYRTACRNYDDCFVAVAQPGRPTAALAVTTREQIERMPIAISSLKPDIPAPWTIDSWLSGTDPAMNAVSRAIREAR